MRMFPALYAQRNKHAHNTNILQKFSVLEIFLRFAANTKDDINDSQQLLDFNVEGIIHFPCPATYLLFLIGKGLNYSMLLKNFII